MSDQQITPDPCKAGGKHGGHHNYDKPHVTGAVYWEDGGVTIAYNCIFCGKDCTEAFRGGMYEIQESASEDDAEV